MIKEPSRYIESFKTLQETGRLSPGWILKGERNIGKRALAIDIAKQLLYQNVNQQHGMPNSFVDKQIDRKSYPNFMILEKSVDEDTGQSKDISAEEGKSVRKFLTLRPAILGWRVVVIDALDDLNRFAANSLLKILEEPPANVCFLMICHQLGNILPTIRSRAKVVNIEGTPVYNLDPSPFVKTLNAFLQGNMMHLEGFSKKIAEADKTLKSFRYIVLDQVHQWISHKNTAPTFVKTLPVQHWVDAYASLNQFFNAFENSHLDPNHTIAATFLLIKNPHLETFADVMSPPF